MRDVNALTVGDLFSVQARSRAFACACVFMGSSCGRARACAVCEVCRLDGVVVVVFVVWGLLYAESGGGVMCALCV